MTAIPYPTGQQFTITHGDQAAVVTEVGGSLRSYRVGVRDAIVSYPAETMPTGVHGCVLLPWPNRIGDGRYDFDGQTYQLALTEPERHNANHGLALFTRWVCVTQSDSSVTLRLDLVPQQGYPFPLRCDLNYTVGERGLCVEATTTNTGATAAPFGIGFHPWLSPGDFRIDECTLSVDAAAWVRADERLLPVEETPAIPAALDFRTPRILGATELDDAFVDLPDGLASVRLADPTGIEVACWQDQGLSCWQLCTGDGLPGAQSRSGVAAEPLSCTADAFRSGRRLTRLEPGATHTARYGLMVVHH